METIEWNESYSVGVKELDEEHKQLFRIINALFEAPDTHMDLQRISELLADMREYASVHFETEEKYMSECRYPDIANHIRAHQRYRDKVNNIRPQSLTENPEQFEKIIQFLYEWLAGHILSCDKKYALLVSNCLKPY